MWQNNSVFNLTLIDACTSCDCWHLLWKRVVVCEANNSTSFESVLEEHMIRGAGNTAYIR